MLLTMLGSGLLKGNTNRSYIRQAVSLKAEKKKSLFCFTDQRSPLSPLHIKRKFLEQASSYVFKLNALRRKNIYVQNVSASTVEQALRHSRPSAINGQQDPGHVAELTVWGEAFAVQ